MRDNQKERQRQVRDTVLRDKRKLKRKVDRSKRDRKVHLEDWQELLRTERADYKARRETREREHELFCEKRQKALKTALAKDTERRKELDVAHARALVESARSVRERRARMLEELHSEADAPQLPLTLGLCFVRQERMEKGSNLRHQRKERRKEREQDILRELEDRLDTRRTVLDADERRRRRGIAAGGGGLGESSGGLVVVSPPRPRRSPQRKRLDYEDD